MCRALKASLASRWLHYTCNYHPTTPTHVVLPCNRLPHDAWQRRMPWLSQHGVARLAWCGLWRAGLLKGWAPGQTSAILSHSPRKQKRTHLEQPGKQLLASSMSPFAQASLTVELLLLGFTGLDLTICKQFLTKVSEFYCTTHGQDALKATGLGLMCRPSSSRQAHYSRHTRPSGGCQPALQCCCCYQA